MAGIGVAFGVRSGTTVYEHERRHVSSSPYVTPSTVRCVACTTIGAGKEGQTPTDAASQAQQVASA